MATPRSVAPLQEFVCEVQPVPAGIRARHPEAERDARNSTSMDWPRAGSKGPTWVAYAILLALTIINTFGMVFAVMRVIASRPNNVQ